MCCRHRLRKGHPTAEKGGWGRRHTEPSVLHSRILQSSLFERPRTILCACERKRLLLMMRTTVMYTSLTHMYVDGHVSMWQRRDMDGTGTHPWLQEGRRRRHKWAIGMLRYRHAWCLTTSRRQWHRGHHGIVFLECTPRRGALRKDVDQLRDDGGKGGIERGT